MIFVRGFGYSPTSVIQNLRELQKACQSTPASFNGGYIALGALLTNPGLDIFDNLIVAFQSQQTSAGDTPSSTNDLKKCLQLFLDNANINIRAAGLTATVYENFRTFARIFFVNQFGSQIGNYDLGPKSQFIQRHVQQGKRVVLVGFGEGSIYANAVWPYLQAARRSSTLQVFIAPFANSMADGSNAYVTHQHDSAFQAINAIASSLGFSSPLSYNGNVANFSSTADSGEKHGMVGYLGAYGNEILQHLSAAKNRGTTPLATLTPGLITVTLTWYSQANLDLHIFEPNFHVYPGAATGTNGVLDIIDSDGDGPEYYYTGCTLQTGNYEVKVNYFAGSGTQTAVVAVTAGAQIYTRTLTLSTVTGAAGDTNPSDSVCTINVSRIGSSYKYRITPAP